ncbi:MAG: 50S ribosomal protein L6 [Proteobacteria bacterium]|nr:50S ribosomal protein L6 [Pseudomonadota bacterium]
MSRIGKNPVEVPNGVDISIAGRVLTAKGKLGERQAHLSDEVEVSIDDGKVWVKPRSKSKSSRTMWGTTRSLIDGLVTGVNEGFTVTLKIIGVGYRAQADAKNLNLQLGFSHDVAYPIPEGIKITCPLPTEIQVHGADKQQVGQVASEIRSYRRPEPYKGKGIRYDGEYVLQKEGKKK